MSKAPAKVSSMAPRLLGWRNATSHPLMVPDKNDVKTHGTSLKGLDGTRFEKGAMGGSPFAGTMRQASVQQDLAGRPRF